MSQRFKDSAKDSAIQRFSERFGDSKIQRVNLDLLSRRLADSLNR